MKYPKMLAAAVIVAGCAAASEATVPVHDLDLVASGEQLYAANCAECHGDDLRGTDKGPSLLSEVYEPGHHADAAFLLALQAGVRAHHWSFGDMPAIQELSPKDVAAIVAFVREQQHIQGFEPYPPEAPPLIQPFGRIPASPAAVATLGLAAIKRIHSTESFPNLVYRAGPFTRTGPVPTSGPPLLYRLCVLRL